MNTRQRGIEAEELVCGYLASKGYSILARNWFCRAGEIDIVASKDGVVSFVEVKRIPTGWDALSLQRKLGPGKRLKIMQSARMYLATTPEVKYDSVSFDVAAVTDGMVKYFAGAFE